MRWYRRPRNIREGVAGDRDVGFLGRIGNVADPHAAGGITFTWVDGHADVLDGVVQILITIVMGADEGSAGVVDVAYGKPADRAVGALLDPERDHVFEVALEDHVPDCARRAVCN